MATVISFINEKGGVGKSSVCFNSAWYFAEQGRRVLLIDLDGQRANLTYICGIDKGRGMTTMYDVLSENVSIKKAVLVVEDNLHIIPATVDVAALDRNNSKLEDMRHAVSILSPHYDYIFIDVSPTPNRGHALALAASDGVIIPMLPDITSLEANVGVIESIKLARREINPDLKVLGIVLNKYTVRALLSGQVAKMAQKMATALGSKVFKTKVRQGVALSENVGKHIGVTTYAPKSKGTEDIINLCKEIEEAINHG